MTNLKQVFGSDLRTLALFRVFLGLLIIVDLVNRSKYLSDHYTDYGVVSRSLAVQEISQWSFSFHLASSAVFFQIVMMLVAGVIAFALIIGYRTKLVTFLSWVLLISIQNRNQLLLQGGDGLFILLLFWSMFLPLGARYSFDAIRRPLVLAVSNDYFSFASVALKIQCMSVYFFGAIIKSYSDSWIPEGNAIYYALNVDQLVSPVGAWFRELSPTLLQGLTYYIWVLQMIGPILMLSPLFFLPFRYLMIFCFVTMHASFIIFMEIGLFPFISIASLLAFTPSAFWEWFAEYRKRFQKISAIYYQADSRSSKYMAKCWQMFTFHLNVPMSVAERGGAEGCNIIVKDLQGIEHKGWAAGLLLLKGSFLYSPLFWLLNNSLAKKLGGGIQTGLHFLKAKAAPNYQPLYLIDEKAIWQISEKKLAAVVVIGLITIVCYWNIYKLPQTKFKFSRTIGPVLYTLRLTQHWNMFAPTVFKRDGWYVIKGKTTDGTLVDVFRLKVGEPSFEKPANVHDMYGNQRQTKYYMNIARTRRRARKSALGGYLCRRWNRTFKGKNKLAVHKIYYMVERTPKQGQPFKIKRHMIWQHYCRSKYKAMLKSL